MSIFRSSPNFTRGYVATGLSIIKLCLTPLQLLMRHLCEVSGLDPNMDVDRARRDQFEKMFSASVPLHDKDYDDDFNWGWIANSFYLKGYLKHLLKQPAVPVVHAEGLGASEVSIDNLTKEVEKTKRVQDPIISLRQTFQDLVELAKQQESNDKTHQEVIDALEKIVSKSSSPFNPGDALTKLADIVGEPKLVVNKKPRSRTKRKSSR
jgi:hypothetical protein